MNGAELCQIALVCGEVRFSEKNNNYGAHSLQHKLLRHIAKENIPTKNITSAKKNLKEIITNIAGIINGRKIRHNSRSHT